MTDVWQELMVAQMTCEQLRADLAAARLENERLQTIPGLVVRDAKALIAEVVRLRAELAAAVAALTEPTDAFIDRVAQRRHDAEQYAKAPRWAELPEGQRDLWRDSIRKTLAAAAAVPTDRGEQ